MKLKHLLLLGYPLLAWSIYDMVKHGLHPDDRPKHKYALLSTKRKATP